MVKTVPQKFSPSANAATKGMPMVGTFEINSPPAVFLEFMNDYLVIGIKSCAIYLFIVAAIRLFGKKELSQLSIIDLVFILLISNSVQNAMVGNDTTLTGGMFAAISLFACNWAFRSIMRRSKKFNKMVQGDPIILVHDGKAIQRGLKLAKMTIDELEMSVREHGVGSVAESNLVVLEVDGNLSVLSNSSEFDQRSIKRHKKPSTQHNP